MIISLIHIIAAVFALATAALVLWLPKGTRLHKRIGYIFVVALLLLNGSAAFIYNLTGSVNFLHIFIVVSLCSMLSGMYAAIRRSSDQWLVRHITGMNGAAIGVWAAGLAEFTVRRQPDAHALADLSNNALPLSKGLFIEFILRERLRAIAYQLFPQYVTSSLFESIAEAKNSYAEVLQSHQSWIAKIKKSNEKFLAAS
ncbi:MAG: DUF2306 domain-containing protein [Hydrococcus sp. RM1_1_31]|nr:DUF2306 domain-containing protein [Hydrococcus sp. RM1_1_31]